MLVKRVIRSSLRRLGYELTAYNHLRQHELRRIRFLRQQGVTLVLDVGANEGQYAADLRALGYRGRIVSFEPVEAAHRVLARRAASDPAWETRREALGDRDGEVDLHVPRFSQASSVRQATGVGNTEDWRTSHRERAPLRRLDSIFDELANDQRVALKLDVQGYEDRVLAGASKSLDRVLVLELEVSLEEMYAGEVLFPEMLGRLAALGFRLASLQEVHVNPQTGRVLQYDALFLRGALSEATPAPLPR